METKLDRFCQRVRARQPYIEDDRDADCEVAGWVKMMNALVPRSINYELHRYMYQDLVHFYADTNCNGCGICEKVCLSEKIALVDDRPVWRVEAKCYASFACINFCPRQAIQIRSRFPVQSCTTETGRYPHSSVRHKDIAWQRCRSACGPGFSAELRKYSRRIRLRGGRGGLRPQTPSPALGLGLATPRLCSRPRASWTGLGLQVPPALMRSPTQGNLTGWTCVANLVSVPIDAMSSSPQSLCGQVGQPESRDSRSDPRTQTPVQGRRSPRGPLRNGAGWCSARPRRPE